MYLRVFVVLLTQTNKRQRTHLGNNIYRKRRRNNFLSLFCAVYPWACWRTTRKAGRHIEPNSGNIWNSSLVTESMLIFTNLHNDLHVFGLRICSILTVLNLPPEQTTKSSGLSLSRDNPSRRQNARDWTVGLSRGGSRSCICAGYLKLLAMKTAWPGYGQMNAAHAV